MNETHRRGPAPPALDRDALTQLAVQDAMRYDVVVRNAARVDQMLERFEWTVRRGDPFPEGAFVEDVIRPFVTWLSLLTQLPDEGEYADVGRCAQSLLRHVPMADYASPGQKVRVPPKPFSEFGSTERLASDDDPVQVARGLVDWTIPLLYRFVVMLKCLVTGEPCTDTWSSLLAAIERHERLPGTSADTSASDSDIHAGLPCVTSLAYVLPTRPTGVLDSPYVAARRPRGEPLYASIRPREAMRSRQGSPAGSSSDSGGSLQAPGGSTQSLYSEPFDSLRAPSPEMHGSTWHSARRAHRDVATQTDSPSWIAGLKRDPNWRTDPLWWGPLESVESLRLLHFDEHAEPDSYC